ncbi:hypothetical protein BH24GEM2_BH24GEM2_15330 [soil metagenome]
MQACRVQLCWHPSAWDSRAIRICLQLLNLSCGTRVALCVRDEDPLHAYELTPGNPERQANPPILESSMKHRSLVGSLLLLLPLSTFVVACGRDEDTNTRNALEREALERDLELALAPDTTAQPELTDIPVAVEPDVAPPQPAPVAAPAPPRAAPARPAAARPAPRPQPTPEVQRRAPAAVTRTPASQPSDPARGSDRPAASEPREPVRVTRTAPSGARFTLRMDQRLSSRTASVGETFTATLTEAILGSDGSVVIPAGATVRGRVTESSRSGRAGERATLRIAFTSISHGGRSYPFDASIVGAAPVRMVTADSKTEQAGKVAGGAAAGAVLGQIIGKNTKSTVAGAVIGAAAGTAVAIGTADVDAVITEGSTMQVELDGPVRVSV